MDIQASQNCTARRTSRACITGFVLAILLVVFLLTPYSRLLFLFLVGIDRGLPLALLAISTLLAAPAFLVSLAGVRQARRSRIAAASLALSAICALLLGPARFLPFTRQGSLPYHLRILKFRLACPCGFWLDFDKPNMVDLQSYDTFLFTTFGSIHFKAKPGTYTPQTERSLTLSSMGGRITSACASLKTISKDMPPAI